jgi:UDP-N-acetyl-D-mannosaminuronic acid dehydrogenase
VYLAELQEKIEKREALIGVVGLGYVGLPLATVFAQAGFRVIGLDVKLERVNQVDRGVNPIAGDEPGLSELIARVVQKRHLSASSDYADLDQADAILIAVETPVNEFNQPEYQALKSVCSSLGAVLKRGALVVVESTVAPGTIDSLVRPLLEESSSKKEQLDFFLGACPERVMPGKLLQNLRTMSRVCGGSTREVAQAMVTLYRSIVQADLDVTDIITAELVKTTENTYRDVQIAFANEVALICEALGADVWRIRELVNKSPYRQMHLPGAGVGGHCIPKDPWLLINSVKDGTSLRVIPAAREVNDSMPLHVVDLTLQALTEAGCAMADARIGVLGYAYLEDSDDIRNSPSEELVERFKFLGAEVVVHDPWVEAYQGNLLDVVKGCDALVLMVAHSQYRALDLTSLKNSLRRPVLIDGRHVFIEDYARSLGFIYRCVGIGIKQHKI